METSEKWSGLIIYSEEKKKSIQEALEIKIATIMWWTQSRKEVKRVKRDYRALIFPCDTKLLLAHCKDSTTS